MSDLSIDDGLGDVDPGVRNAVEEVVRDDHAVMEVRRYFADDEGYWFTGAWFERLDGGGDAAGVCNIVTPADVVALSMLSVRVTGTVAKKLLVDRSNELSQLLTKIPTRVPLWNADRRLLAGPGNDMFELVRSLDEKRDTGHRWVTAHKLLARKRPELFPIRDSVVRRVIKVSDGASWWLSMQAALQVAELRDAIDRLRADAGVPSQVTVLRTLDIATWMHGRRVGDVAVEAE